LVQSLAGRDGRFGGGMGFLAMAGMLGESRS